MPNPSRASISFATFAESASKVVAYIVVAVLTSGVLVLLFPAFRGQGSKLARPSRVDRAVRES